MRVLITGATGFVGRHLCKALTENGHVVTGTHRGTQPGEDAAGVNWVRMDDVRNAPWRDLLEGHECVVHLAALAHQIGKKTPDAAFDEINHVATMQLSNAIAESRDVRRLVFISSIGAACTFSDRIVREDELSQPDSDYGRSKRNAELAIENVLGKSQADWVVLRPTLVYGPGNPGNMQRLMRLAESGIPLPFGAIRNRRSFVFVSNLVNLIERCLSHPAASRQIFNASDSEVLSTPELITQLGLVNNTPARIISFPVWSLRLLGAAGDLLSKVLGKSLGIDTYSVQRLTASLVVDNQKAREKLGWDPPYSTTEGLRLTFDVNKAQSITAFHQS